MNKKIFRSIVILYIVSFIVTITTVLWDQSLPPELEAFNETQLDSFNIEFASILLVLSYVHIAAIIGLIIFAQWSRLAFTATVITSVIANLFMGPVVETALNTFLSEVVLLLDGLIVALLYFSGVSAYFDHTGS